MNPIDPASGKKFDAGKVSDKKPETNRSTGGPPGIFGAVKNWFLYLRNKFFRGGKITGEPIFIVGCGHSGTSLLLVILNAHSKIFGVPYESRIAGQRPWRFRSAMRKFDRWTIAHGKQRWVEKTPKHILHIGEILKYQPNARILLIIRDGRDVACSLQKRFGSIESGIQMWVERNMAGKKYWSHPNVYLVKYESLISDFEKTMTEILTFVGEEYEAGIKEYFKSPQKIDRPASEPKENHEKFRSWKINQPIFDTRGKWKNLPKAELDVIDKIGAELLAELGYTSRTSAEENTKAV